jgi:hypothetical protein
MSANCLVRGLVSFGIVADLLSGAVRPASANNNCQRLEALSQEYAGLALTADEEKLKRRLVIWYKDNCREHRTAQVN